MKKFAQVCLAAALLTVIAAEAMADAPPIPKTPALKKAEIVALLDGKSYSFTAFDAPLMGTTTWDHAGAKVSGDYDYDGTKGTYTSKWFIKDDKSCTESEGQPVACQTIYAYENGFMEVNEAGKVHAVSVPK